jgi:hypothetical protein
MVGRVLVADVGRGQDLERLLLASIVKNGRWRIAHLNEYHNLPRALRHEARDVALSGVPSGKPHIDQAAYAWYRGQIVAVLAVAITFIIFSVVSVILIHMNRSADALACSVVPLAVGFYQWRHIRKVATVVRKER